MTTLTQKTTKRTLKNDRASKLGPPANFAELNRYTSCCRQGAPTEGRPDKVSFKSSSVRQTEYYASRLRPGTDFLSLHPAWS